MCIRDSEDAEACVGNDIPISLSIGVAQWTREMGLFPDRVMAAADHALYAAKRDGKNRHAVYEPAPPLACLLYTSFCVNVGAEYEETLPTAPDPRPSLEQDTPHMGLVYGDASAVIVFAGSAMTATKSLVPPSVIAEPTQLVQAVSADPVATSNDAVWVDDTSITRSAR